MVYIHTAFSICPSVSAKPPRLPVAETGAVHILYWCSLKLSRNYLRGFLIAAWAGAKIAERSGIILLPSGILITILLLILFQFNFLHLSQNRVFHTIPQIGLIQRFLSIIQICPRRFLYQKCRKVALPAKIFLAIDVARRCLQDLCNLCIFQNSRRKH